MKKFFIAATAILLATATLEAQTQKKGRTEKHHKGMHGHKGMNLNEDQKKQFKEIKESYHKQFADLKNNKSLSAEQIKARSAALRKEQHEKLQSLLTAEQKARISARKDTDGEGRQNRGKNFEEMKKDLGLSDDQALKLKNSQKGFHDKVKAIRENKNLSESQKKDQLKELSQERKESMQSILTAEQLEKMKNSKKGKRINSKR